MEEVEQSGQSDVSAESSPATESKETGEASASQTKEQQYVPYDRFKELVEQKNQFSKRFEDTDRALKELQAKLEANRTPAEKKEAEFIKWSKDKGLEPEFLKWAQEQEATRQELNELKQWREQYTAQSYLNAARSQVEALKNELKVDPVLHNAYLAQIPHGTPLDQIAEKYKAQHEVMGKFLEAQKRAALSEYTSAKKTDSKVPGSQKGQTPKASTNKSGFSKDPEEARLQLRKHMVDAMRSGRDI
jgi:hypothetical protein